MNRTKTNQHVTPNKLYFLYLTDTWNSQCGSILREPDILNWDKSSKIYIIYTIIIFSYSCKWKTNKNEIKSRHYIKPIRLWPTLQIFHISFKNSLLGVSVCVFVGVEYKKMAENLQKLWSLYHNSPQTIKQVKVDPLLCIVISNRGQ